MIRPLSIVPGLSVWGCDNCGTRSEAPSNETCPGWTSRRWAKGGVGHYCPTCSDDSWVGEGARPALVLIPGGCGLAPIAGGVYGGPDT